MVGPWLNIADASADLFAAIGEAIVRADVRVAEALHADATPAVTAALRVVTHLGSGVTLLAVTVAAAGVLTWLGRRRDAALLALVLAGAQLLTWSLKGLFQRERPTFDDPLATASWFSYPSGHALTAAAVYGALAWIIASGIDSRRARAGCLAGAALLVAAIGFSRLYLGVHYLSDVLAGCCGGVACLLLAKETVRVLPALVVRPVLMPPLRNRRTSYATDFVASRGARDDLVGNQG